METKYFFSKSLRLVVEKNDAGAAYPFTVKNLDGTPYENAGNLIGSFQNNDKFWARCISKEEFEERLARFNFSRSPEFMQQKKEREAALEAERREAARQAFEDLAAAGSPIPATYDNIAVILHYLNTQNWGAWKLPALSVGYTANQYDCDGKSATTLTLDEPIMVGGEPVTKFETGAPHGHLRGYHKCR